MFHAPFAVDKDRWEAPAKLSMGSGQFARGTLTYEKTGMASDGNINVAVSGELKAEGKFGPADIKNSVYKVKGEQVYDPAGKIWRLGQLTIDVSLDLVAAGNPAGSTSGTMKLGLQRK